MNTELLKALAAFQKDPPRISLDAKNPHYKSDYASLPGILDAVLPKLSAQGLVLVQAPCIHEGAPALWTMLAHAESAQFIEAFMPLVLEKNTPQGQGSALTYARRYAILSFLGLVGDEDDDGQAAEPDHRTEDAGPTPPPRSWTKVREMVEKAGGDYPLWEAFVRAASYHQFGKTDSKELTPDQRKIMLQKAAGAAAWVVDNDNTPMGGTWSEDHMRQGWAAVLDGTLLEVPDAPKSESDEADAIADEVFDGYGS